MLKGQPGCGKSTLGRALSTQLGWLLIDKDDIVDIQTKHYPPTGTLAYEIMFNLARRQLEQGQSVICDSPLTFPDLYEEARKIAHEAGALLAIIEIYCSDQQLWKNRVNARKELSLPSHRQANWGDLNDYLQRIGYKADYQIHDSSLRLDTISPLPNLVKEAIDWLEMRLK
jgi:predicted kinase